MSEYETDQRLIELETRVAYQDDTILKLKHLVEVHQKQLYHLEQRFGILLERFKFVSENRDGQEIPNEKPPHY